MAREVGLDSARHRLPVRALNFAGRVLSSLGLGPVSLDPESLLAEARRQARADDFGSRDFERGLEVLVGSAERDAELSLLGRLGMRGTIVSALTTRLLHEKLRKNRPELFETALVPPLIVIGLPRSGTTLLHRLLALDPNARSLAHWEVRKPHAPPGRDTRRRSVHRDLTAVKFIAPSLDAKHFSTADEPEECMFLLDPSLVSANFWVVAPVYGYLDWYVEQDQIQPYRGYREYLQVFQAATPQRRLTLKAPIHTQNLSALVEAVPNAKIVQLHRDPAEVLGSVNSLFCTLHRVVTERLDLRRMGRKNLEFLGRGIDKYLSAREALGDGAVVDVYYDELVGDPVRTVRGIYDRLGFGFDVEFETRLREFVAANPQHKRGTHRYRTADFGLTDSEIRARLNSYLQRFPRILDENGARRGRISLSASVSELGD